MTVTMDEDVCAREPPGDQIGRLGGKPVGEEPDLLPEPLCARIVGHQLEQFVFEDAGTAWLEEDEGRAGINVRMIYTSAFVLCAMFAALGGVMAAARLASASQQAGTGDVNLNAIAAAVIGGTSLFGGRGSAYSAVLGIIVIQSIASGLTLLNLSSSLRFMITGAVLAIAVIVDSLARQSRVSHGRA